MIASAAAGALRIGMPSKPATKPWTCPKCRRKFARKQQRHICSAGTRADVLKDRREKVVDLFAALEQLARSFGPVEFIARERYIILRGKHIFTDVVLLGDALQLVVHLPRLARHPLFRKIVADRTWVSHTAKVRNVAELEQLRPFLRAAYDYAESY
jgi:hypothetical protein